MVEQSEPRIPSVSLASALLFSCLALTFSSLPATAEDDPLAIERLSLGLATTGWYTYHTPVLLDTRILFLANEAGQAADLNEDGDRNDTVLHSYQLESKQLTNHRICASRIGQDRNAIWIQISVSEDEAGEDLNGDGDRLDYVLHVLHRDTLEIRNLGLALNSPYFSMAQRDSLVAVEVEEYAQGRDLNQDGDQVDVVLHLADLNGPTVSITNLGMAAYRPIFVGPRTLAFVVYEFAQGERDLNGDDDGLDFVLATFDLEKKTFTPSGFAVSGIQDLGDQLAFRVPENSQGETDLNGDQDSADYVAMLYSPETNTVHNLGLAAGNLFARGGFLAFPVSEVSQGRTDLDGNGSAEDEVMHVVPRGATEAVNLRHATITTYPGTALNEEVLVYRRTGRSDSIWAYDIASETSTPLPVRGTIERLSDDGLLILSDWESTEDLNFDGDRNDRIVTLYETRTGKSFVTGLARHSRFFGPGLFLPWIPGVDEDLVVFSVAEDEQGRDLNSDGDLTDFVLHTVSRHSDLIANLRVSTLSDPVIRRNVVIANLPEFENGGDRTGDADILDSTLEILTLDFGLSRGSVDRGRGRAVDVLFLNGSSGASTNRRLEFDVLSDLELSMIAPPGMPAGKRAPFVVYAWPLHPTLTSWQRLPFGIGCTALPTPLSGGSPQPSILWNNTGRERLGNPDFPSEPAPSVFLRRRGPLRGASRFYLQGIIYDPGSAAPIPASVTNGISAVPVFGR